MSAMSGLSPAGPPGPPGPPGFPGSPDADRGFEVALGRLLRIGVAGSSLCLASGLVMALVNPGGEPTRVLASTGLVLLMATPAARVVLSAVSYARRRDWAFTVLTLVVLLELAASVVAAFKGGR